MTVEDGAREDLAGYGQRRGPRAELVELLWRDPKARSRNRNFYRFRDDPSYRRAARHVRTLRALRSDLVRWSGRSVVRVAPDPGGEGAWIELVVPSIRLRRKVYVTGLELELLRKDVGDLLPSP